MKRHINPILKKEIKLGARTVKLPIAVVLYALFMIIVSQAIIFSSSFSLYYGFEASGTDYKTITNGFSTIAFIQIFAIGIIIPIISAGTIAGERERQTLDILLTTPVSRLSIAWGKLSSILVEVFMFVISSIPSMSVCFLYGGIQWQNIIVFIIATMVVAFFAGAVGILCSSIFKKTIVSVVMTLLITTTIYFLPAILYLFAMQGKMAVYYATFYNSTTPGQINMGACALLLLLSPAATYYNAITTATSGSTMLSFIADDNMHNAKIVELIFPIWNILGMIVTILLGILALRLASRVLDSARRKGKKISGPAN